MVSTPITDISAISDDPWWRGGDYHHDDDDQALLLLLQLGQCRSLSRDRPQEGVHYAGVPQEVIHTQACYLLYRVTA